MQSTLKYRVKLKLKKCTFGVASEKFLAYLVTQQGIEANLDQIFASLNMKSPACVKEVHVLNGRLATLNWLLNLSTDKCKLFFQATEQISTGMRNARLRSKVLRST